MRVTSIFAALLMLSACATAAPTSPGAVVSAPVTAPPNRVAQLLAQAGSADAPTEQAIERALGAADITRRDGVGAALTYRLENCALLLLFAADRSNAMRLTEAHPSARRNGAAAPSLEQCAAEIASRTPRS